VSNQTEPRAERQTDRNTAADRQADRQVWDQLLPVDDDGVGRRLIAVPAALLVTTPAEEREERGVNTHIHNTCSSANASSSANISAHTDGAYSLFFFLLFRSKKMF